MQLAEAPICNGLEAKGRGTKANQAPRLLMKSTLGMPLVVWPIMGGTETV